MPEILIEQPLSFLVEKASLEKRRDVSYYHPKYLMIDESLNKCPFEIRKLKDKNVTRLITDGHHGSPEYVDSGVPYLRVVNINPFEIELDDLKFISRRQSGELGERCHLRAGDVILSIVGTIGTVAVVSKEFDGYSYSRDLARIVPEQNTNPFYLAAFLHTRLGQSQMERKTSGAVQKGLYLKSLESIKIPIPPHDIQDRIANIIKTAYEEKLENIQLVSSLLDSTDMVIYEELGVEILEVEDRLTYWVESDDLKKRRDPMFYHPKYLAIEHALASLDNLKTLDSISKEVVSGSYVRNYVDEGMIYLRITNVKEHDIDLSDVKFVDIQKSQIPEKIRVKCDDILLTRTGTIGIAHVVPPELEGTVISQHLTKISVREGINPHYIALFLNTKVARQLMERGCTGGLQKELIHSTVKSLKIPIPHSSIQEKIVERVREIKEEAKKLHMKADETVKKAKRRVEEIIEGKTFE